MPAQYLDFRAEQNILIQVEHGSQALGFERIRDQTLPTDLMFEERGH
jgi:hypothetical protein